MGFLRDERAQFTMLGLIVAFVTLIVTADLFPLIYDLCENVSSTAMERGDWATAYIVKLIPFTIVGVELASIYYYAKPYIIREE